MKAHSIREGKNWVTMGLCRAEGRAGETSVHQAPAPHSPASPCPALHLQLNPGAGGFLGGHGRPSLLKCLPGQEFSWLGGQRLTPRPSGAPRGHGLLCGDHWRGSPSSPGDPPAAVTQVSQLRGTALPSVMCLSSRRMPRSVPREWDGCPQGQHVRGLRLLRSWQRSQAGGVPDSVCVSVCV